METIKVVVALLLFTGSSPDEPLEYTYVDNFGKCLEMKRKAERNSPNIRWSCTEVEAVLEQHKTTGDWHIVALR